MRGFSTLFLLTAAYAKAQMDNGTEVFYPDEGPCDQSEPPQGVATPTFCQPSEHQGDYGVRYYQMSVEEFDDALTVTSSVAYNCYTLDYMHCDGTPDLCLKWGEDPYVGRVMLPQGVKLFAWEAYSAFPGGPPFRPQTCEGKYRFTTRGPTVKPYDFWDYSSRVDGFTMRLEEGYFFNSSAKVPVQRKNPCTPKEIVGRWTYWFSQQSGETTSRTISIGLQTTETVTDQQTYTFGFAEKVSFGSKVGNVLEGGEGSWSVELSAQQSVAISHLTSNALQRNKVDTETKTLTGGGTYWQFVMYATNANSCESPTSQALLPEYIRTANVAQPPCCAPGLFHNIDEPTGDCVEGAARLCQANPPSAEFIV